METIQIPQIQSPMDPQEQSPLFRLLPAELRTLVWRFALLDGASAQHFLKNYAFPGPVFERFPCHPLADARWIACQPRYARAAPGDECWEVLVLANMWRDGHLRCAPPGYFESDPRQTARLPSPLDVLLSCRLVYTEAVDLVYARISRIPHWELEQLLMALPTHTLGHRLRELEVTVRIDEFLSRSLAEMSSEDRETANELTQRWRIMCGQLSELPGLRRLNIWFDIGGAHDPDWFVDEDGGWAQGLGMLVGKVQDLEVSVNTVDRDGEATRVEIGGARLRRRGESIARYLKREGLTPA